MNLKKALKVTLSIVGIAWGTHEIIKRTTSEEKDKNDIEDSNKKNIDIKAVIGNGMSWDFAKEKLEETKKMFPDKMISNEENGEKLTEDNYEVIELEEEFFEENLLESNNEKKSNSQKLEETLEKEVDEALNSDKETMNEIEENDMTSGVIDEGYSIPGEFDKGDSMSEVIESATKSVLYEEELKEEIDPTEKIINPGDVFVRKEDSNGKKFDVTLQIELHLKEEDLLSVGINEIPYVKIFRESIVSLSIDTLRGFTASNIIINNIEEELKRRYEITPLKTIFKKITIREA